MAVTITLRVRALQRSRLQLELGDARIGAMRPLNGSIQRLEYRGIMLPPGTFSLILRPDEPAGRAQGEDSRSLAVALYELTIQAEQ